MTTVAEYLSERGFFAIDGDCAIQSLRNKKGIKEYDWHELLQEVIKEIDIASLFCQNIVLSHVIKPEDLCTYITAFKERSLDYKLILLRPSYQSAVERCQTRTCHTSVTPEKWIRYFYDTLSFGKPFHLIDNTVLSVAETAEIILKIPFHN